MPPNAKLICLHITSSISNVCLQEVVGVSITQTTMMWDFRSAISVLGWKQLHCIKYTFFGWPVP